MIQTRKKVSEVHDTGRNISTTEYMRIRVKKRSNILIQLHNLNPCKIVFISMISKHQSCSFDSLIASHEAVFTFKFSSMLKQQSA